jgi:hypothetical protein
VGATCVIGPWLAHARRWRIARANARRTTWRRGAQGATDDGGAFLAISAWAPCGRIRRAARPA